MEELTEGRKSTNIKHIPSVKHFARLFALGNLLNIPDSTIREIIISSSLMKKLKLREGTLEFHKAVQLVFCKDHNISSLVGGI